MASPSAAKMAGLSAVKRHHLLAEFAGLKQACPHGVYVSLTPGDPSLWSGVIFVRKGPYAPAILRFHISFPDSYPDLPPLVTFSTDIFHPLVTPLTTYMYSTDVQHGDTFSASDDERLPPGGFSLRHGFPNWFGRRSRARAQMQAQGQRERSASESANASSNNIVVGGRSADGTTTPTRPIATATGVTGTPGSEASGISMAASVASSTVPTYMQTTRAGAGRDGRSVSTYEVLRYIRSTFDDELVLDSVPLEAAGNPGAWHAWRTHRRMTARKIFPPATGGVDGDVRSSAGDHGEGDGDEGQEGKARSGAPVATTTMISPPPTPASRRPEEWNWEGVWEERVKRGVATSLSEAVLFGGAGTADELINFLNMDENEVEGVKSNLLRTLGAVA